MEQNGNGKGTFTVKEAAEHLGMTPRGVRQRISRGKLKATQLNGEWLIYLNGEQPGEREFVPENNGTGNSETVQDAAPRNNGTRNVPHYSSVTSPERQATALMEGWIAPLTKTIQEQAEEIGRLKAQLEQEQKEKAALVEVLDGDATYPEEHRPGFWSWLFGR